MKTHRVNRLSKCANVLYRKRQVFLWFTISSQLKLKKNWYTVLEISTNKNSTLRFHGGLFELEI